MRAIRSLRWLFALLAATEGCANASNELPADRPAMVGDSAITVGANVRITLDGDFGHVEPTIAASPTDPNVLMAAATVFPPGATKHDRVYVSTDGGGTWATAIIPFFASWGSADPAVGIDPSGRMYITAAYKHMTGAVFTSTDSGKSWSAPRDVGPTFRMSVGTTGSFSGRVYLSQSKMDTAGVPVEYSSDGGRTFRMGGRSCHGFNVGALTLSNGSVMVICGVYDPATKAMQLVSAVSNDGGLTFAAERVFAPNTTGLSHQRAKDHFPDHMILPPTYLPGNPCAANARDTSFRDRVHCVWTQADTIDFTARLYTRYSTDRGESWSAPRLVDSTLSPGATQALPMIAVNRDGVVGIAWLDTRQSAKRDRYDLYFAASRDGGATYLPPVRVSTASSFPKGSGNMQPTLFAPTPIPNPAVGPTVGDELHLVTSPFEYGRQVGGDYAGMAATPTGEFYPVWPDARSGGWQIYTARIRVAGEGESVAGTIPDNSRLTRARLTRKVSLRMESSAFDSTSLEMIVHARLHNTSADTLYGPFSVEVVDIEPGPTIVNATNGTPGKGAIFEYAKMGGTFDLLPPGSVTEPLRMRFRIPSLAKGELRFQTVVHGQERPNPR